jgi:hypothetical protein
MCHKVIAQPIEEQDKPEEVSDMGEDRSHVTIDKKPGHYAQEFPLPPMTCMYCHASNHSTEQCSTLLVKIQEKSNQNNQNVQWISVESRDDRQNINIVTRGGTKIGNDAVRQDPAQNQWVRKNPNPKKQFDAQKEKEIFTEA